MIEQGGRRKEGEVCIGWQQPLGRIMWSIFAQNVTTCSTRKKIVSIELYCWHVKIVIIRRIVVSTACTEIISSLLHLNDSLYPKDYPLILPCQEPTKDHVHHVDTGKQFSFNHMTGVVIHQCHYILCVAMRIVHIFGVSKFPSFSLTGGQSTSSSSLTVTVMPRGVSRDPVFDYSSFLGNSVEVELSNGHSKLKR